LTLLIVLYGNPGYIYLHVCSKLRTSARRPPLLALGYLEKKWTIYS